MRKSLSLLMLCYISIIPVAINAQYADSIRIFSDYGIGNITLGQKLNKKQLKRYENYKKVIISRPYHKPFLRKKFYIENGLEIFMRKKKRFSFTYIVDFITAKSPFRAITEKGIELGKSSRKDILEKYGIPDEESEFSIWYKLSNNNRLYFYFLDKEKQDRVSEITISRMPKSEN